MQSIRVFLALALLAPPLPAGGPRPAPPSRVGLPSSNWMEVAQTAKGTCIAVVGPDQIQRKVTLVSWSAQALTVSAGRDREFAYAREDVLRVGIYKRCKSSRAALYGALFGFTIGVLATAMIGGGICVDCAEGGTAVVGALAAGGAVAAASALVASRSSDQPARWIYERP